MKMQRIDEREMSYVRGGGWGKCLAWNLGPAYGALFVGAAIGSSAGPLGTVAGAVVGGTIGVMWQATQYKIAKRTGRLC